MVITSIPAGPMTVTGRHAYFQLFAFDPKVRVIAVVYLLIVKLSDFEWASSSGIKNRNCHAWCQME